MNFDEALEKNPAPLRVGDVRLRYDSPLLLGEADRELPGTMGLLLVAAGLGCAAMGALLLLSLEPPPFGWAVAAFLVAAALVAAGAVMEDRARRRRRFALNFEAHTLRLDFTLAPKGLPRSLVVPFDQVRALTVLEQPDGRMILTVDVDPYENGPSLREVLAAGITPAESPALFTLHRMLDGAFDL